MKKGTSFFYIFISIICLAFCACKIELEDTELMDAPQVTPDTNQVSIIIPRINNDTKYINVFRKDSSKSNIESIGIVYPKALLNKDYFFVDELIIKNHYYKYMVRYCDNDGYHESKWSNEISTKDVTTAHNDTESFQYSTSSVRFKYNRTEYTLTIEGTIGKPDFTGYADEEDNATDPLFKPMLIISKSGRSEAIPIASIANNTIIPLRNILPANFLDTDISILGLVAQKNEYENRELDPDKRVTKYAIWTELAEITLRDNGSSSTIRVPAQVGEAGLDYTLP